VADGAHALGALALGAQLAVVDDLGQAGHADSRVFLRSWSKKNLASARRGRTTRSLPPITALGSCGLMLLTIRNWLVSLPEASSSGKYFWLAFIVRIRHS
jgi:hypothetical protein